MSGYPQKLSMVTEDPGDLSDIELFARISAADHGAFEILYRRYYPRLFRFAFRVTRRLDQVEEIINDTLFTVWTKSSTFTHEARPSTWIFGIAYKKCLKSIAQRGTAEHLSLEDAEHLLPWAKEDGLTDLEIEDWLSAAFGRLPPDQRAVLELTYHHDLSYREIARIMDCPENTVKTRMFHARKKMRSLCPDLIEIPRHEDLR